MLEPGSTSSKKMKRLIELSMKKTFRTYEKALDSLLEIAGDLEYLAIEWQQPQVHMKQLLNEKSNSRRKISEDKLKCLKLAVRHDTSLLVFFDLWRELGQTVRELICSNYGSVPRSLRWMVETCIFWADMQLDDYTVHEWFEHFYSQKDKLTEEEFRRTFYAIYDVNEARLVERLAFREKYRRLAIGEILNNLSILKGDSKFSKAHLVKYALRTCYSEFSKYSHTTLPTLREIDMEPGELHMDFAFFQDYHYDKEEFETQIQNIYRTLDIIIAVIILVETDFFCYEAPHKFCESLGELGKEVARKIHGMKDNFPFTDELMRKCVSGRK
jgi:hypothetical protein